MSTVKTEYKKNDKKIRTENFEKVFKTQTTIWWFTENLQYSGENGNKFNTEIFYPYWTDKNSNAEWY